VNRTTQKITIGSSKLGLFKEGCTKHVHKVGVKLCTLPFQF